MLRDHLQHPRLVQLNDCWDLKRAGRRWPTRNAIDPHLRQQHRSRRGLQRARQDVGRLSPCRNIARRCAGPISRCWSGASQIAERWSDSTRDNRAVSAIDPAALGLRFQNRHGSDGPLRPEVLNPARFHILPRDSAERWGRPLVIPAGTRLILNPPTLTVNSAKLENSGSAE